MTLLRRTLLLLLMMAVAGCNVGIEPETPPTTSVPSTATALPTSTVSATGTPSGPVTLMIWVPPQFDTQSGSSAGDILQARLDEFEREYPDVRIEVRVKAIDGPGGLLDALSTASAAAPLTLPDLVALPRHLLETAALKGLLHPYEGLSSAMDEQDWYEYARQMSRLQDSTFGLPFAGDVLVLVFNVSAISDPPADIESTLDVAQVLAFPAADPQALFTLTLYQAAGGTLLDEQGRPYLDEEPLQEILAFYHEGALREIMPVWLTQYSTYEEVWKPYLENQASMLVAWISQYLSDTPTETGVALIPAPGGTPFTLATGWVWGVASPNDAHQTSSAQLAEFLTESEFLAEWTSALGLLPPRSEALADWQPVSLRYLVNRVSSSAQIIPPADVLNSLGPPLEEATVGVLKQEVDPLTAAEVATEAITNP